MSRGLGNLVLPHLRASGSGRGRGGGKSLLVPEDGWRSFDSLDGYTNTSRRNTDLFVANLPYCELYDGNNTAPTLNVTAASITGSTKASYGRRGTGDGTTSYPGGTYIKWNATGYGLDSANGWKIMSAGGCANGGASRYHGNDHWVYAVCVADGFDANQLPNTYIAARLLGYTTGYIDPDLFYIYTRFEGESPIASSPISMAWNTANWPQYQVVGLDFPPGGVGNFRGYGKVPGWSNGNTPYDADTGVAVPDWAKTKVWDGICGRHRDGGTRPGYGYWLGFYYSAWTTAWPTLPNG